MAAVSSLATLGERALGASGESLPTHARGPVSWPAASALPKPHGPRGELTDLLAKGAHLDRLRAEVASLPNLPLSDRQICDVEMLLNGGFTPLTGFMNPPDYDRVCSEMRLADGTLWPIPITLDVSVAEAAKHAVGSRIALEDHDRNVLAVLSVESIWRPDKQQEGRLVFGKWDLAHPSVEYLAKQAGEVYMGGRLEGLQLPEHYDFVSMRQTPRALRAHFEAVGWAGGRIVAFQTRNPMHRSHRELTVRAARDAKAALLVQPVVGMTKPGDVDHYTRVRCYQALMQHYPRGLAHLALLPLAMRMAGPREALLHALIRKNYGATHFIVGRDHAGPGNDSEGKPFYGDYAAHQLVMKYTAELGIEILFYQMVVYVEELSDYLQVHEVPPNMRQLNISGTELRRRLFKGLDIPHWFTYPEVVKLLRQTYPPRYSQGFTVFFTGLSGAGKSTIANALRVRLLERDERTVTLLDGDQIRLNLSSTLGFSKEDRDRNVERIGFVAAQIARARGIALCAAIAPYAASRAAARKQVEAEGGFVEVHVATNLEVCEARDRKGLYQRARAGQLKGFTGIDDPYEAPANPELRVDSGRLTVLQAVELILLHLEQNGYLPTPGSS